MLEQGDVLQTWRLDKAPEKIQISILCGKRFLTMIRNFLLMKARSIKALGNVRID